MDDKEKEQVTKRTKKETKREDLETLSGTNWLNDEVINDYMDLIRDEKTYVMSSFFFPRLHHNGYAAVKRWTKKVNIFKYEKVIVPINLGNHWCLATINFIAKTIMYYDSFKKENPRSLETLLQYLIEEARQKEGEPIMREKWHLAAKMDIPRQSNGYDCGVFVCMYARCKISERKMEFTQNEMPIIRAKMMREFKAGCLEE
ncbi:sentrin-specific protease 1-like [Venturia canescens]|uniref:sentrin-specific protease 1-like n=1 Tax=Venturia canescens TaxID=32260 RepID=UPI001C9C8313|nr:sentrin-specific protease 1-like [Venturia canescens]